MIHNAVSSAQQRKMSTVSNIEHQTWNKSRQKHSTLSNWLCVIIMLFTLYTVNKYSLMTHRAVPHIMCIVVHGLFQCLRETVLLFCLRWYETTAAPDRPGNSMFSRISSLGFHRFLFMQFAVCFPLHTDEARASVGNWGFKFVFIIIGKPGNRAHYCVLSTQTNSSTHINLFLLSMLFAFNCTFCRFSRD